MKLSPTSCLIRWLASWTLFGLLPVIWPTLLPLWLAVGGILLVMAINDAFILYTRPLLQAERQIAPTLPLGTWCFVRLRFNNLQPKPATFSVFDHYPTAAADCADLPQRLTIKAGGWAELHYCLRPVVRGKWTFSKIQIWLESPCGWWQRDDQLGQPTTIRVYPDFSVIANYIRLSSGQREIFLGIHRRRRRGEGQTFFQLREYRVGDSLRQIDWKATARTHKLIAKDYQDERHQTVLFLLDCSRRMRAQDDDLSHFDHALNAMILLSYVALHQGDAVGVQSFGGEQRWFAPCSGTGKLNMLINAIYDLQPALESPDYIEVATQVMRRQRKRALVVLLTNLRDEDQTDLRAATTLLSRRHLLLIANLRESILDELLTQPIRDIQQAHLYMTTCYYHLQREQAQETLKHQGSIVLDTSPRQLPVAMVNQYLEIKRGGRL